VSLLDKGKHILVVPEVESLLCKWNQVGNKLVLVGLLTFLFDEALGSQDDNRHALEVFLDLFFCLALNFYRCSLQVSRFLLRTQDSLSELSEAFRC